MEFRAFCCCLSDAGCRGRESEMMLQLCCCFLVLCTKNTLPRHFECCTQNVCPVGLCWNKSCKKVCFCFWFWYERIVCSFVHNLILLFFCMYSAYFTASFCNGSFQHHQDGVQLVITLDGNELTFICIALSRWSIFFMAAQLLYWPISYSVFLAMFIIS